MFYDKNSIEKQIQCPHCKHRYTDPRILPCYITLCHKCAIETATKCLKCNERHELPTNGFPINEMATALITLAPVQVSRGPVFNNIMALIDKLSVDLNDLDDFYKNRDNLFNNYVDLFVHQVDVAFESMHEEVNKRHSLIIDTIEEYRKRENYAKVDLEPLEELMTKSYKIIDDTKVELEKKSNMSEQDQEKILENVSDLLQSIRYSKNLMEYFIHKGFNIDIDFNLFLEKLDTVLPKFYSKPIKAPISLTKLKHNNNEACESFSLDISRQGYSLFAEICSLNGSKLVALYEYYSTYDTKMRLTIYSFNIPRKELKLEKSLELDTPVIRYISMITCQDNIYVSYENIDHQYIIECYDDKLDQVISEALDYEILQCCVRLDYLYVLVKEAYNSLVIYKYDLKLNFIEQTGQDFDPETEFYLYKTSGIYHLPKFDLFMLTHTNTNILKFLNPITGLAHDELMLPYNDFFVRSDSFGNLFILSSKKSLIEIYVREITGYKLYTRKDLSKIHKQLDSATITSDGYLAVIAINNNNSHKLYFY